MHPLLIPGPFLSGTEGHVVASGLAIIYLYADGLLGQGLIAWNMCNVNNEY